MPGIRWTDEEYNAYLAGLAEKSRAKESRRHPTIKTHSPVPAANLESNISDETSAKNADKKIHSRVRIQIHSRRRRLCDPDGIYAKAAIDGLCEGGLLSDDSAEFVDSVSFSQEKTKEVEETIIEIV